MEAACSWAGSWVLCAIKPSTGQPAPRGQGAQSRGGLPCALRGCSCCPLGMLRGPAAEPGMKPRCAEVPGLCPHPRVPHAAVPGQGLLGAQLDSQNLQCLLEPRHGLWGCSARGEGESKRFGVSVPLPVPPRWGMLADKAEGQKHCLDFGAYLQILMETDAEGSRGRCRGRACTQA